MPKPLDFTRNLLLATKCGPIEALNWERVQPFRVIWTETCGLSARELIIPHSISTTLKAVQPVTRLNWAVQDAPERGVWLMQTNYEVYKSHNGPQGLVCLHPCIRHGFASLQHPTARLGGMHPLTVNHKHNWSKFSSNFFPIIRHWIDGAEGQMRKPSDLRVDDDFGFGIHIPCA